MKGETVPSRMPADESFSSWTGVERDSYKPISPWVDRTSKYRNEVGGVHAIIWMMPSPIHSVHGRRTAGGSIGVHRILR